MHTSKCNTEEEKSCKILRIEKASGVALIQKIKVLIGTNRASVRVRRNVKMSLAINRAVYDIRISAKLRDWAA